MNTHHPSTTPEPPQPRSTEKPPFPTEAPKNRSTEALPEVHQPPVRRSASDEGGPVRRSASDEGGKIKNHLSAKASAAEENSKIPDPQPPVRRSASDEGGSTLDHQLLYFSDPDILRRVDRQILRRFLEGFESDLSPEAAERLHARCLFDEWCSFWAAHFKAEAALAPNLLATLLNIETLAQPKNAAILDQAIAHLPPGFEINRHFHPVGQALHLWLIAQNHPEAPWPRTARDARGGDVSSPVPDGTSSDGISPTGGEHGPHDPFPAQSKIENQNSKIEQPSFSSLPSVQIPSDFQISNSKSEIAAAAEHPSAPSVPSVPCVPSTLGDGPAQSKIQNQNSKIPAGNSNRGGDVSSPVPQPPPPPSDFERLAALSPVEYDHVRKAEAKRLGIRLATLDDEVDRCRAQQDDAEAAKVMLPVPEPWPEPVTDAPALFDAVRARFPYYVYLPAGADILLTLFLGHVHAFPAFHYSPRLNLISTKEECGKSTVVAVFASMATKTLRVHSLKPAVVYRVAEQRQPTLCLDEVENYLPLYRELLALLNAGNSADACAPRCEGRTVRFYKAFTPVILSGIGDLCRTLRSRSILIPMTEAPEGAGVTRFNPKSLALETELARKLARWAADHLKPIAACDPPLPRGARNRLADNWRPLFQIAHTLGAHWPDLAEQAFNALKTAPLKSEISNLQSPSTPAPSSSFSSLPSVQFPPDFQISNSKSEIVGDDLRSGPVRRSASDEGGSTETPPSPAPIQQSNNPPHDAHSLPCVPSFPSPTETLSLLQDLRLLFSQSATDRLSTQDLLARLASLPDRPWRAIIEAKLNPSLWLASQLRPFNIRSRTLWLNGTALRGYLAADFPSPPQSPDPLS